MNTVGKLFFTASLTVATSVSYATPHASSAVSSAVNFQSTTVEAEYPSNQARIEQFKVQQQRLINQLEMHNQIEFEERVNLDDKLKPTETNSVTE